MPVSQLVASILKSEGKLAKDIFTQNNFTQQQLEECIQEANNGNINAQYIVGYMYFEGKGVEVNMKKGVEFYLLAANKGHMFAQFEVGYAYDYGNGVLENKRKAFEFYLLAANQGHITAQCTVGFRYEQGEGVQQDHTKAFEYYLKSANQGLAAAHNNLGRCYANGQGVSQDFQKAIVYYQMAIEQGHTNAKVNIGWVYNQKQEYDKAMKYFLQAAEEENALALRNIGVYYELGRGVAVDYNRALSFYQKSAEKGNEEANKYIERLTEKMRTKSSLEEDKLKQITSFSEEDKTKINNLETDKKALEKKVAELEQQKKNIEERAKKSEKKVEELEQQKKNIEERSKAFEKKVEELEQQKKNFEERAKALEQHFKEKMPQVISDTKARFKEEVQERLERVRKETAEAQAKIFAAKHEDEKKELRMKKETLEKEKQSLDRRVEELQERERKMEEREKVFAQHYNKWKSVAKANLAVINKKQADDLFQQVVVANNTVVKDKEELADKLARAEELREKLEESERVLKQKVECLQNYLAIVEKQGLLPEAVCFKRFLKAVKHMNLPKVKCFISYAWSPDKSNNAALQAKLLKMKGDLKKTGMEVMLDITNMEGDIDEYMLRGIDTSCRVLLICTPRLRERAGEQKANNLQKELNAALSRQKVNPKFIVPLILEGDRDTSIPVNLPNILSMDFSKPEQYCELMTSLTPKGLIPLLFGLDENHLYAELLRGYHAQVELLQNKQRPSS